MASLSKITKKNKNGKELFRWRILFSLDKERRNIYLGEISQKKAEQILPHVEDLISAKLSGQAPCDYTSAWLGKISSELYDRLVKVGLAKPRSEKVALGKFVRNYIESRSDIKKSTREHLERVEKDLIGCFGVEKYITDFTESDGDEFRLYLIDQGLAENTIRRRCGRAKQFFTAAVRKRLIDRNPFELLKSNVQANPERFHFVGRETIDKIMDVCPSNEWRLIIALSRYGGLRCPSEVLALTWKDVNWEKNRIRIPSPKTEHHAGGESRVIPLFPELRPYLEAVWDETKPGAVHIITSYRDSTQNLRSRLLDFIHWAGVEPWTKPFQNMRSTRETELAERFPMHVVCKWIGNTESVAAKHYLQLTDEHFDRAVCGSQNGAQSATAKGCPDTSEGMSNPQRAKDEKSRKVATGNILRLLADFGCKPLSSNDLHKLPDEDSNLGQSG